MPHYGMLAEWIFLVEKSIAEPAAKIRVKNPLISATGF